MRLDSFLFVAILFACFNTSSTKSSTTSVESLTSNQKDVPDHESLRDGGETTEQERGLNLPGFDKAVEGFKSIPSNIVEKILYWFLLAKKKNAEEAYKLLRLDNDNSKRLRNARYNAWVRYLAKATVTLPADKSVITKLSERHGEVGLLKLLKALIKAHALQDLQAELESKLIYVWKNQERTADYVSTLLKLDQLKQQQDTPLYLKLSRLQNAYKSSISPEGLKENTVILPEGLRKDKRTLGTIQNSLKEPGVTTSVPDKTSAEDVVAPLKHDKDGSESNVDVRVKNVLKTPIDPKAINLVITKLSRLYGDEGLLKVLDALIMANAREDIQIGLQSALMTSWKYQKSHVSHVFELLGLNNETDHRLYVKMLTMWVEYGKTRSNGISEMQDVIAQYEVNIRLMVLDGLSEIEDTGEIVKPIQDSLVTLWGMSETSVQDVFIMLELAESGSQSNFDVWVKFAVKAPPALQATDSQIMELSKDFGSESFLKMFEAWTKAAHKKDIQALLKSALMNSLNRKSAMDVFKLFKLDQKPRNVIRLRLWVLYVNGIARMPVLQMGVVINDYGLNVRVNILGSLRHIEGTEDVVENLEKSLVELFQKREDSFDTDKVVQVFKDLKLDDGLEKLLLHPNLDLFNRYAAKFEPRISKERALITAAREVYDDIALGTMLEALCRKGSAMSEAATPLRRQLFRQWKFEARSRLYHIEDKLKGQLLWSYKWFDDGF